MSRLMISDLVQTVRRDIPMPHRSSLDLHEESGQTMAEYAVVLGVITLAIITAFTGLSGVIISSVTAIAARV